MSGKEEEVFPGVTERRYFLRSSAVAAAALFVLGAATRGLSAQELAKGASAAGADKLSWDNFLKESVPVGQQLIADPAFSMAEYLYRIGSPSSRLKQLPGTNIFT